MNTVPMPITRKTTSQIVIAVAAIFMAMIVPLPATAAHIANLPLLPEGVLPNSEISTNIPLRIDIDRIDCIMFEIGLDSSASNCLMVALGESAGDELTLEDVDIAWGYDCGVWVFYETETGLVRQDCPDGTPRASNSFSIPGSRIKPEWNMLRVVKRGVGDMHTDICRMEEFKKFSVHIR